MIKNIYSVQELNKYIEENPIVVIYFSNGACNVCKILKPKIKTLLGEKFSKVSMVFIDTEKSPVISGQYRVFTIPTIDIYVDGKEYSRFSRNVMMHEFEKTVQRPYEALFSDDSVD